MFCKADRGNTTAILYKRDYLSKVNNLIESNYFELIKKLYKCTTKEN